MGNEAKDYAKAAIDLIAGLGGAIAGGLGGPAVGTGVVKAGEGLNKIIDLAAPDAPTPPPAAPSLPAPAPPPQMPASPPVAYPPPAATNAPADANAVAAYLVRAGWTPEQIRLLLAGPQQASQQTQPARPPAAPAPAQPDAEALWNRYLAARDGKF